MRVLRIGTLGAIGLAACAAAVAVGQSGPDKAADIKASIDISKPKNIILFIGDGMGEQEVTSGRYYGKGATGRLNMDALKLRGDVTTYNVGPAAQPPYPPNYVPDSAPTASAWSSGIKTLDGRLGQGPSSGVTVPGTNFKTYMEIARDRGMATGNVSSAEITEATPAGPSSHISQRG
jgi:alkaline phosphatase